MDSTFYSPSYENSFALIIGINNYLNASPLGYAVNDAKAVADMLKENFDFQNGNIKLLLNESATKNEIMSSFMSYANSGVSQNDRIFVFFAGHGMTQTGRRGEVGFLVPHDGNLNNLSTLIRWDDLTRNAELIAAKHIFFVMDACYGGLAITRSLSSGSIRFLKDMLQRYSRQVLTAGKANEVVADAGGPIPNHSVFTGHFLQALQGKAATSDGVITANGVMAYVYDRVAKDLHSQQTPHYGFLDGDGDFIFNAPSMKPSKIGSLVDAADFKQRSEMLIGKLQRDERLAPILNGVHLPLCLPMCDIGDYGRLVSELFLPQVKRAYESTFANHHFQDSMLGKLNDQLTITRGSRQERLIEKMATEPVVGIMFPVALQGYSVQAAREQLASLPEEFVLSGVLDTCVAIITYTDVLATDHSPTLVCAGTTWQSDFSLCFHPGGKTLNFCVADEAFAVGSFTPGMLYIDL